ncbi:hypothetical protein ACFSSC_11295 [Corynebacterium mendelii]|uniref:Uncharacterized protein n=1 Tax=Corynebacterium mendelii TaxID=2765362 RepID=A0A939DZF7_9CORY|nr:hypothetical protein [Corynebacterium mendelii]MBN9643665.1 hypothetical protein [Corynebacterium mendelii]
MGYGDNNTADASHGSHAQHHDALFLALPEWSGQSTSAWVMRLLSDSAFDTGQNIGLPVAKWRRDYPKVFNAIAELDPVDAAPAFAERYLDYLSTTATWPGTDTPVGELAVTDPDARLSEDELDGLCADTGQADRKSSAAAVAAKITTYDTPMPMTPSATAALDWVAANPDSLSLRGTTLVVIGGGAQLSPVRWLVNAGATVVAVVRSDSPGRVKLVRDCAGACGRLILSPPDASDPVTQAQKTADFIASIPGPIAVLSTLYIPGSAFVHTALAADCVVKAVAEARDDMVLCCTGSPSEAWRLPDGTVTKSIITLQGPNYLSAKLIERSRALAMQADGRQVIAMILPPSPTESVTISSQFEEVMTKAPLVGVYPASPRDASGFAAGLLAYQLANPDPARSLYITFAVHAGMWGNTIPARYRLTGALIASRLFKTRAEQALNQGRHRAAE